MTMQPMRQLFTALVVSLLIAASSAGAEEATIRILSSEPGRWRPWTCGSLSKNELKTYGLTQSDVNAFQVRLRQIAEVFRSSPAWSPPIGADPSLSGSLFMPWSPSLAAKKHLPIAGTIMMGSFEHYEIIRTEGDKEEHERYVGGETLHIMIDVNALPKGGGINMLSDKEGEFYEEPVRTADMFGFPTYGDVLIIAKNGRPVWTPISRERFLKAFIAKRRPEAANAERYIADQQRKYEAFIAPDAYAARQVKYKAAVDKMAAKGPAAAEHEQRYWERDEADTLNLLKRGASRDPKDSPFAAMIAGLKAAEEQLGAMSPADRSAPACLLEDKLDPSRSGLVPMGTPDCKPLVGKNPNFFDPSLPRGVPQIITAQRFRDLEQAWKKGRPDENSNGTLDLWTTYEAFYRTDWRKVADHIGR